MIESSATTPISRDVVARIGASEPAAVRDARLAAFAAFESMPFPTESTLGWRRTDLAGIDLHPIAPAPSTCIIRLPQAASQAGVVSSTLEEAVRRHPVAAVSSVHTGLSFRKFSALAQAAWQQGGFLQIPPGSNIVEPIHIDWQTGPYPRLAIVVGKNARATVVEQHGQQEPFVSGRVDLVLEDGAHLNYIHVQDSSRESVVFSHQRAEIARDAKLVTLNFGLGGKLARTDVEVELMGAGAESDMLGLVFAEGEQQFDYHTLQGHRSPNTRSDLLFKAALDDRSHSAYTGVIIIDRGAQRSDAYQANRNLLLSEGARADTEPMLEIEADDVRCTHGATVGPVDEEQLFYTESRGLAPDTAARLIVEGFFDEVFEKFGEPSVTKLLQGKVAPHVARVGA
ncbi:MAG TPA: Fe-S cluster assembly protein SufD [Candidatus Acidoferrales bacterium]|nr:Fe-S cluster assembly protein SufD [Candidatus Acidoferrales bacterium]